MSTVASDRHWSGNSVWSSLNFSSESWFRLIISRTLRRASRWCKLWGLMRTVLQFEAVRSFSFYYAKREAVSVRNCCWKKWVFECLTVSSNMSKLKSVISPCSTVSRSQNDETLLVVLFAAVLLTFKKVETHCQMTCFC